MNGFIIRLLIFASEAFVTTFYLSKILKKYTDNVIEIVCPSKSKSMPSRGLRKQLKQSGWRYFVARAIMRQIMKCCDKVCSLLKIKKYYNLYRLAGDLGIRIYHTKDYNSPEFINRYRENKPDYLISCCIPQKLNVDVLNLANKKALNIHAAPLPKYGGIAPGLWAMANNEKMTACTVHIMAPDLDVGDILIQEFVQIQKKQSLYNLILKQVIIGQNIFLEALEQLEQNNVNPIQQDLTQRTYFSHPKTQQIKQLRKNGYVLLRIRDVLHWIEAGPSM